MFFGLLLKVWFLFVTLPASRVHLGSRYFPKHNSMNWPKNMDPADTSMQFPAPRSQHPGLFFQFPHQGVQADVTPVPVSARIPCQSFSSVRVPVDISAVSWLADAHLSLKRLKPSLLSASKPSPPRAPGPSCLTLSLFSLVCTLPFWFELCLFICILLFLVFYIKCVSLLYFGIFALLGFWVLWFWILACY